MLLLEEGVIVGKVVGGGLLLKAVEFPTTTALVDEVQSIQTDVDG